MGRGNPVILSSMPGEPLTTDIPFNCPFCGSNQCLSVVLKRPNGDYYTTLFFKCAGCSVVFLDPERFSKQVRYTFDPERSWSDEKAMRAGALTKKQ